jgi:hypothetical protein
MKPSLAAIVAMSSVFFSGCAGFGGASPQAGAAVTGQSPVAQPDLPAGLDPSDSAAAAYCTHTRGEVEIRRPVYEIGRAHV